MEKLWAGRAHGALDKAADDFNSSISVDSRMYRQDIRGSIAHAGVLAKMGIVSDAEGTAIIEGLGGILGFGKKGGYGFRLIVTPEEGEPMEIELVSGLGTYLEIRPDKRVKNALLNPKRRRGNANVVWDFQPVEREALEGVRDRWLRLVNGEDASVTENR